MYMPTVFPPNDKTSSTAPSTLATPENILEVTKNEKSPCCELINLIALALEKGILNLEYTDTRFGRTPLLWAICKRLNRKVEALLHHGASIFAVDNDGQNALHHAIKKNNGVLLDFILKAIAKEKDINKRKLIYNSIAANEKKKIELKNYNSVVKGGWAPMHLPGIIGLTPLQAAMQSDVAKTTFRRLLSIEEIDVNAPDIHGQTILQLATRSVVTIFDKNVKLLQLINMRRDLNINVRLRHFPRKSIVMELLDRFPVNLQEEQGVYIKGVFDAIVSHPKLDLEQEDAEGTPLSEYACRAFHLVERGGRWAEIFIPFAAHIISLISRYKKQKQNLLLCMWNYTDTPFSYLPLDILKIIFIESKLMRTYVSRETVLKKQKVE